MHKVAVVRTLFSRANTICSSTHDKVCEEGRVTAALRTNGYPSGFILSRSRTHREVEGSQREPEATAVLPYIRGVSEAIQRILRLVGIRSAFKPVCTLRETLVHVKDPVPMLNRQSVVYRIPCEECTGAYVGQTGRSLGQCVKEHKRALKNFDVTSSGLSEHALESGHRVVWTKAAVVDSHQKKSNCLFLESWHIGREPCSLNREKGPLAQHYRSLLHYMYTCLSRCI